MRVAEPTERCWNSLYTNIAGCFLPQYPSLIAQTTAWHRPKGLNGKMVHHCTNQSISLLLVTKVVPGPLPDLAVSSQQNVRINMSSNILIFVYFLFIDFQCLRSSSSWNTPVLRQSLRCFRQWLPINVVHRHRPATYQIWYHLDKIATLAGPHPLLFKRKPRL